MTSTELNTLWRAYRHDTTRLYDLFNVCRLFARKRISSYADLDTEDLVHHCTWKAWEHWATLPTDTNFAAWFGTLIRHATIDARRKQQTRRLHEDTATNTPVAEPVFDADTRQHMLANCDEKTKPIVSLLLNGLTLDEAAEQLNRSVRSIRRALTEIKREVHYG